jgi:GTP cyclohydrolase I
MSQAEVDTVEGAIGAPFDHRRAAAAVRELPAAIGEDPDRDGLAGHPRPGRPRLR